MSDLYDIVVLGTGAAGLSAALTAASTAPRSASSRQAPTVGGTTAVSGGVSWVPAHKRPDVVDPPTVDEALIYLAASSNGTMNEELVEVYVEAAEPTLEFIEAAQPGPVLRRRGLPRLQARAARAAGRKGGRVLQP